LIEIQSYMSQEQRAYLEAAAALVETQAQVDADTPPPPKRGGGDLEAYARAREAAAHRHNLYEAVEAKLDARWALLDWAKGILEVEKAGDPDLTDVLAAFDTAPKYPEMLEELVGLCLQMNPDKEDGDVRE